jgi:hypothetical protein
MSERRRCLVMGNERAIQDRRAKNIVREYNKFIKETKSKVDEVKKATMLSLKQLLNLSNGDVLVVYKDGNLSLTEGKEAINE